MTRYANKHTITPRVTRFYDEKIVPNRHVSISNTPSYPRCRVHVPDDVVAHIYAQLSKCESVSYYYDARAEFHHDDAVFIPAEPTRLLSTSYAVFCLKKKKRKTDQPNTYRLHNQTDTNT